MSRTEELIAAAQSGDALARETLLVENNGLIWSVARRFLGRGTESEDLYQLGCLGFIKAIDGFDRSFGTQFSTYAVPKISGEIRRYLRDDGAVKVSRSIKERAFAVNTARNQLLQDLGREPTLEELAQRTGICPEDIAVAQTATACVESMQQEGTEDGFSLENILSDTENEDSIIEKMALRQCIGKLPEREAMVINLRYFHAMTQEQVCRILHISQVQVSRIEKKAILRLRELLK